MGKGTFSLEQLRLSRLPVIFKKEEKLVPPGRYNMPPDMVQIKAPSDQLLIEELLASSGLVQYSYKAHIDD